MTTSEIALNKISEKKELYNFTLFSFGKLISIFGSAIYTFAIGLFVLQNTGSGLSFATTLVLGTIPMVIVNPFAGVMADRFDKKKLVVSMDILNGVLLVSVYLLSFAYGLNLMMIYVSTFIMTAFTCIFGVSLEAAKPNIVSDRRLVSINSVSKIIDSISSILGPMVGGIVFALIDIKMFILINGISFIFSGISEMFIDFNFNKDGSEIEARNIEKRAEGKISFIKDIKEGFIYIASQKNLINFIIVFIALNFCLGYGISVPLPYIINNILNLTSGQLGLIEGAFPVGLIIGAMFIKKVTDRVSFSKLLGSACIILAISMIFMGIPLVFFYDIFQDNVYVVYYSLIMMISGISISFIDIPIMIIFQKMIPEEYRGRVLSLSIMLAKVMLPVALIISGILINKIEAFILPITAGLILSIVGIVALKSIKDNTEET
jgi:MFS family permease